MIIIVGAGIAGLSAALTAVNGKDDMLAESPRHKSERAGVAGENFRGDEVHSDEVPEVLLISKTSFTMSNTLCAQGGIAAAIAETDSPKLHAHDTLMAGDGLCDEQAVDILTTEGAAMVRQLAQHTVDFDRDASSQLQYGMEGAHSQPRILHAGGDATGYVMEQDLASQVASNPHIHILEFGFLEDLCIQHGAVEGIWLRIDLDREPSSFLKQHTQTSMSKEASTPRNQSQTQGEIVGDSVILKLREEAAMSADHAILIHANAVILATGGAGQAYEYTTNPKIATGDGVAAAWRAGASIADAEFYQFHPTALNSGKHFLVSEAVRGEGAQLLDAHGRRYMLGIDPRAELAPRDIVARANFRVMQEQQGEPVRLDATVLAKQHPQLSLFLKQRFPTLNHFIAAAGFDWSTSPIPVTPAAHYWMGGIRTDVWGRSNIHGLFAAGECARTGVHGANRLASNSLLEGLVFGRRAAIAAVEIVEGHNSQYLRTGGQNIPQLAKQRSSHAAPLPSRQEVQTLMWKNVGVIRNEQALQFAVDTLADWLQTMNTHYAKLIDAREHLGDKIKSQTSPTQEDLNDFMENRNLVTVGYLIARAALNRPESVGAHAMESVLQSFTPRS